jgi:chloramphenicol-sensitive protein RarD
VRHRWRSLGNAYASAGTRRIAVAGGTLLAINWGVFVWAVNSGHIVDASFGYFINPLVSVALGVAVLHEHLRRPQAIAVGIAAIGVVGMAIMGGIVPWISLTLAFSFGTYGLLKKQKAAAPALEGLFGEVVVVAVPATILVTFLAGSGRGSIDDGGHTTALLITAGAVTVIPLLLFGASAQRIRLSTVGLLQYITPSLQLLIGIVVYGEAITAGEVLGFGLVWVALALFAFDGMRTYRSVGIRA